MPERVLFEGGDPEYEPEKPDPSEIRVDRGRKLIRVGLLLLLLGLLTCLVFVILVVAVVPDSLSDSAKDQVNQVTVVKDEFGKTADGITVERYTLTNKHNMKVQVITYGARVISISVPDRHGDIADVILGCDKVSEYEDSHLSGETRYLGAVIGRVLRGTAGASFVLDNVVYNVSDSTSGWHKRLWSASVKSDRVIMTLRSLDGENGFPGQVDVNVTYQLTNDNKLMITYAATTKYKPTPIDLSSRIFFNLAGEASGSISNHSVSVFANYYFPTDTNHVPTGSISSVSGTAYDLHNNVQIGLVTDTSTDNGGRFDVTYSLRGPTGSRRAARVYHADSGRVVTVFTNQPALRFYTSDELQFWGKKSDDYHLHSGFLLESQNSPAALHHSNLPDSVLTEGSLYLHEVVFAFTTEQ